MDTNKEIERHRARVALGWQCPECFGVRVKPDSKPFSHAYECQECGCHWTPEYYQS